MNKFKVLFSLVLIGMMLLGYVGRVEADVDTPSTFFGPIKFVSGDTPGTEITAYVPGVSTVVGTGAIGDFYPEGALDGILDYSIDVRPDNPATTEKDGGSLNDLVTFKIGERIVANTATFDNTRIDPFEYNIHPPFITNTRPIAVTMSKNGDPTDFSLTLTAADEIDTGDTLTWSIAEIPNHGTAMASGTGESKLIDYSPTDKYYGPDSFKVKVTDSLGGEDIVTVSVTINQTFKLTVNKVESNGGTGSVSSSPSGIDCGSGCSSDEAYFDSGTSVTLTATPTEGDGSIFSEWTGVCQFGGNCNLTMDSDETVTAKFDIQFFSISGYVYLEGTTTGLSGVALKSGETVLTTTGTDGFYTISVPYSWDGTITPSLSGYKFLPSSKSFTDVLEPKTQDFYAEQIVQSIDLEEGWNLVSFNVVPLNPAINQVLASISGSYDLVYAWDASVSSDYWKKYDPNPEAPAFTNPLTELHETMGFWIRMTAADTLVVYGSAYPTSTLITLHTEAGGWNLVGFPAAAASNLPGALSAIESSYTLIYSYRPADLNNDPWKLYDPSTAVPAYVKDLKQLDPGFGYWIRATVDNVDWTVPYTVIP